MCPPATTQKCISSGHGAWAPRPGDQCSPDVFTESDANIRVGDAWTTHCVGSSCHEGAVQQASQTVFINGSGAVRLGDEIDCGGFVIQGASTVFIGD